jgi:Flp pilus assembly protein TadD
MPPNSEIEKLERRWRENPKGTVFAPYAEVLRKNGDHELAKDILRQGLELHPDHIPGNIVLGRCSIDLGEDGPAEQAFSHVLELDAENVIALQALADITERHGRLAEARDWLGRLVAVDPSNDVARDQIARVEAAQPAATAMMSASGAVQLAPETDAVEATVEIIPPPLPSTVKTREIEVFARPKEGPLAEPDRSEIADGEIRDTEPARIVDDAEAAFDALVPPPIGHVIDASTAKTVELEPLMPPEPAPIADLEPIELDIATAAKSLEPAPLADIEPGNEFAPPAPEPAAPSSFEFRPEAKDGAIELRSSGFTEFQAPDAANELLDLKPADRSEFQAPDASNELLEIKPADKSEFQAPDASTELLDITPAPHSEFQAPDASHELLNLAPSGSSEFQTPDASQELAALSGSANPDYQAPSGAEDLLAPAPEPEPATASYEAPVEDDGGPSLIADLAALTTAPTEEIATTMLPAIEEPAASATEAPEAVDLTEPVRAEEAIVPAPAAPDWLFEESGEHVAAEPVPGEAAAGPEPEVVEPVAAISERIADAYAGAETEDAVHLPGDLDDDLPAPVEAESPAEVATDRIAEDKGSSDLKLIFPDDAALPEPHQVRRITQEVELPAMAGEAEEREPEPILTESMAELYARQGHTAEALRVYRALAEQAPHDTRLRERIADLEIRTPQPPRRMTYVALETGGESVESFFRALADSRPGGHGTVHATGQINDDDGSGAPTRPARDPLSLSAIFGEDPAAAKPAATPVAPAAGTGTDAFSFDQFFGSGGNGGGQAAARPDNPSGEDLDQFQHWLKSLKK